MSIFLNGLSKEQAEAASSHLGTNAIVATAGAGKTTTMAASICLLLEKGVKDSDILATTFTNAAAKELKERVNRKYGREVSIKSGTIHSFSMELMIKYHKILGYKNEPTIIDERTAHSLKTEIALELTGMSDFKKITAFTMEDINKEISDYDIRLQKNSVERDYDPTLINQPSKNIVREIAKKYSYKLRKYSCLDFDKILVESLRLLEVINTQKINVKLPKYLFIDEAQDLSAIQWLLIYELSKNAIATTVIGDDDQSIYLWRGAKPWRFIDFVNKADNKFFLSSNRRCGKKIVDIASSIVSVIPESRRVKKDLSSARDGFEGKVRLSAIPTLDSLNLIAEKIKREVYDSNGAINFSDYAIIVRSTTALFPKMEGFLTSANVPYEILGGKSSYESSEGRLIKKILHLSCINEDFLSLTEDNNIRYAEIRGDVRLHISELLHLSGVSQGSVESIISKFEISNQNTNLSISSFLDIFIAYIEKSRILADTKATLTHIFNIIKNNQDNGGSNCKIAALFNNSLFIDVIKKLIEKNVIDFLNESRKKDPKSFTSDIFQRKFTEITTSRHNMLLSLFFYPYQNDSIKTALYSIELSKEDSLIENDKFGKVTLTTCHSSKGLEWKKVYILEVNSNNWPSAIASRTIERTINSFNISEEIIDEERRLLYVAITRAKDEVCLVSSVIDSRTLNFNEPSFFLSNEIRGSFSNIMEFVRENKKSKGLDL